MFASLVIGSVGFGLFLYGKKELRYPQLFTGLALMIYPMFVPEPLWMIGIAAALLGGMWALLAAGK